MCSRKKKKGVSYRNSMVCRHEVAGLATDLSVSTFVDDIVKLIVQEPAGNLDQLIDRSVRTAHGLEQKLKEGGYAMNQNKACRCLGPVAHWRGEK